jgi:hypothetical protein
MPDGRVELEYGATTDLLRSLTDVRFKLLAFVPTIAGTAVALLGRHVRPAELLAVGGLGLVATLGVVVYELHNTELYEYALGRAESLERELGLALLSGRPSHARERPLALVYAAVLGAWSYLVAWGALAAAGASHAQQLGGAVAAAAAVVSGLVLLRRGREIVRPEGESLQAVRSTA